MVNLNVQDRQELIGVLVRIPELTNEQGRRQALILAGLETLVPMIDVSGSTFVAVNQIVNYLANYGRLSYTQEALGGFLSSMKNLIGIEQQHAVDLIINKYAMMVPSVQLPSIKKWNGSENNDDVTEKIIHENTLRPIAFLSQGLVVSRSVSYLQVEASEYERWSGSGFLIGESLLLTNHHVISSIELAQRCKFRFNFQNDFMGREQQTDDYSAARMALFYTNRNLDYTIIELDGYPGRTWGCLSPRAANVAKGNRVNIIQHPAGQPKQVSLQNNFVEYVGGDVVQYITATLPGSSGSPVFDNQWELVAVHHAGGMLAEPTTKQIYYRNEGILFASILKTLPAEVLAKLSTDASGKSL